MGSRYSFGWIWEDSAWSGYYLAQQPPFPPFSSLPTTPLDPLSFFPSVSRRHQDIYWPLQALICLNQSNSPLCIASPLSSFYIDLNLICLERSLLTILSRLPFIPPRVFSSSCDCYFLCLLISFLLISLTVSFLKTRIFFLNFLIYCWPSFLFSASIMFPRKSLGFATLAFSWPLQDIWSLTQLFCLLQIITNWELIQRKGVGKGYSCQILYLQILLPPVYPFS